MKKMLIVSMLLFAGFLMADPCLTPPVLDQSHVPFPIDVAMKVNTWKQVKVGQTLVIKHGACDIDGDPTSVKAIWLPEGAVYNTSAQSITWTPTKAQIGVHYYILEITDAPPAGETALSSQGVWVVNVQRGNKPPSFLFD